MPATKPLIDDYRRAYAIHKAYQQLGRRKAQNILNKTADPANKVSFATLREIYEVMADDDSDRGFEFQTALRARNSRKAAEQLEEIRNCQDIQNKFLALYEPLCEGSTQLWHSGGLARGKTAIAGESLQFRESLIEFDRFYHDRHEADAAAMYNFLSQKFAAIPRAGTNVITEILHTYDNTRCAIMNQNSVSGMELVGFDDFPSKPGKTNMSGEIYGTFCLEAVETCEALGLRNLSELDAVFNYAYWEEWEG